MIRLLNPSNVVDYVLKSDTGKKEDGSATIFHLGVLNTAIMGWIIDKSSVFTFDQGSQEARGTIQQNNINYQICRFGIRGWENLLDYEGNQVEYRTVTELIGGIKCKAVAPDIISKLPLEIQAELSAEITRVNNVSKDEEKNSEPQS